MQFGAGEEQFDHGINSEASTKPPSKNCAGADPGPLGLRATTISRSRSQAHSKIAETG
jgi:hypothetical protein